MDRPIKVIYAPSKAMWITKLGLRGIALVMGISLIGVVASLTAGSDYDRYYDYYADDYLPLAVMGAQLIISICWNIAEVVCLILKRGHRGIHPGACVAMDLILWLGLVAGVVMLFLICWGGSCSYDFDEDGDEIVNIARRNSILALGIIVTIAHFVLFVIACWETSVRNRAVRVILDRNGLPLKGSEPGYKLYQNYQAQLGQVVPQPPPAAVVAAPIHAPALIPAPAQQGHNYTSAVPTHPIGSYVEQPTSHPGSIPPPSEVSSASPPPNHLPHA